MYFPSDMTFQYFFFSTYIGYFFQALPIALLIAVAYGFVRYRTATATALQIKIFTCIFVCYLTGLVCLVIGLDMMGIIWYWLLYRMDPGYSIAWFSGEFDFVPDFFNHLTREVIGNFVMFLPFGVLYPLSQKRTSWKKTVMAGLILVLSIETLQPVFGRAFDLNDIILNSFGIVFSATVFFSSKQLITKLHT